jgi:hypothetical protein
LRSPGQHSQQSPPRKVVLLRSGAVVSEDDRKQGAGEQRLNYPGRRHCPERERCGDREHHHRRLSLCEASRRRRVMAQCSDV